MNNNICKLGFGTWAIGGDSYGKTDDMESINALEFAYEHGINFFDTADLYGKGHSEKLLGKVFKNKRDKVILASKVGYDYRNNCQNFTSSYINKSIENSLKRLKTDYLDIYFLHSPPLEIIKKGDAFYTLSKLKEQGKILQIGISLKSIETGHIALKLNNYSAVQFIYNLLDQKALENGFIELAKQRNVFTVARVPLCFGFLTGKYTINSIFSKDDQRSRWSIYQRNKWITTSNLFKDLFQQFGYYDMDSTALKFCLSTNGISCVIPGMKNKIQVERNLQALFIDDFNNTLKAEIFKLYKMNNCIPNTNSTNR